MSEQCEDCGRLYFDYGDRVRLVQNNILTGQIIGERNWHQEYLVRIGSTFTAIWLENVELEPDPQFASDIGSRLPGEDEPEGDNVVKFPKKAGGLH